MSLGKNIKHDSSLSHVTGSSVYIDDRPTLKREVFVTYVGSPVAKGKLKKIITDKALAHEKVLTIYTASDFKDNKWGTIVQEQPLLVEEQISYLEEPICIIVSDDRYELNNLKKLVEFDIDVEEPTLTIDQGIKNADFLYTSTPLIKGDAKKAIIESPHKLSGVFECEGQDHFYLESQAAIAYPMEKGMLEVHASSQHPTETQHVVAKSLGLNYHQVVCEVKRMGGAFGGKESQAAPIAAYAALVASKLNRPARIAITKDEDMCLTGNRHPFKNFYEVGFDEKGRILGLNVCLYANAGAYTDLSPSILDRGLFHIDGAYYLENAHIEGHCVKTNIHSNTAFRGFGGPQGHMTIESILEDIAAYLELDPYEVRRINVYGIDNRNTTPYGQVVENNQLPKLFDELYEQSDYKKRLAHIENFNQTSNGKLRGISLTTTKFGIAFTAKFLNQGNALVNIHVDGTIQVSTGATEMGQGVNTKIAQVAAHEFGIDTQNVEVMTTSTEKNHNTSPTAASSGSDINGAATSLACIKIKRRLSALARLYFENKVSEEEVIIDNLLDLELLTFKDGEIHHGNQKVSFKEIVQLAYLNRISLGDYAHFKTKGIGFDKKTGKGKPFNYFTQGTAVSEIEIDEYTGQMKVLRTDILMDLGRPMNPGIDKGQVSGGFIQGMGWVTSEKLFYNDQGALLSHSPTTYKIPSIQDTPRIFNINLIENHENDCNIYRSKAVGEPPFLLGVSVWTAIKHALSFRNTKNNEVRLMSPATPEVILMTLERLKDGRK